MEFKEDNIQYRKYVIHPRHCILEIGDLVTPDTIMGLDWETCLPIKAGINGQIITIYQNQHNGSLMMLAVVKTDNQ